MADFHDEYQKAKRTGEKAVHTAQQEGKTGYLPVLEELVPDLYSLTTVNLGLIQIPIDLIEGTVTGGRSNAFAPDFMPLQDSHTEFADKWSILYASMVEEGLRVPVTAVEYMNRFYILEGNKRVSVSKFLGSVTVDATVTRYLPKKDESRESKLYYEFVDFYKDSKINYLWFTVPGSFISLTEFLGINEENTWNDELRSIVKSMYINFKEHYSRLSAAEHLNNISIGDAMLKFIEVFGVDRIKAAAGDELKNDIISLKSEFILLNSGEDINVVTDTPKPEKRGFLASLMNPAPSKLKVGFIYRRKVENSGWIYWHDMGRIHIESVFADKITTVVKEDIDILSCEAAINELIDEGVNVIFITSAELMGGAIEPSVRHPEVYIFNCSQLAAYKHIISYYMRIYEAKFIIGAAAGALCKNGKIGYIADYPTTTLPSALNAFALGAQMTNPDAKVYLSFSTLLNSDVEREFNDLGIEVISNKDIAAPHLQADNFGLYTLENGKPTSLIMPVFHWGSLYEAIISAIFAGSYNKDADTAAAMSYYMGMSNNAMEVVCSRKLDRGVKKLVDILSKGITDGCINPFIGPIKSQTGEVILSEGEEFSTETTLAMDWLNENVVGTFPTIDQLVPEVRTLSEYLYAEIRR